MGVATPGPSTSYGKELAKFEQHHTRFTDDNNPPGNPAPARPREYPRMVYRAIQHPRTKQMFCIEVPPNPMLFADPRQYDAALRETDQLNRQCWKVVDDEDAFRRAKSDGWVESPALAVTAHEDARWAEGGEVTEAAHRHFRDKSMSPRAQAEAAAIDASTEHQVPSIPAPKKRRGRKPNAPMVTVPEMPPTAADVE